MRNLLITVSIIFIFIGCTPKNNLSISRNNTNTSTNNSYVQNKYEESNQINVIKKDEDKANKIAIIYPSRLVNKYAKTTVNTITGYLLYNNVEFELETYDTYTEAKHNIIKDIQLIKEKGYTKVIALFTETGFNILNKQNISDMKVYFPLINKDEVYTNNKNFIFGGISYKNQIKLLSMKSSEKSTMFYIKSYTGNKLKNYYDEIFSNMKIIKEIKAKNNRYKYILKDKRIKNSSIFLNTPIIESSIIMSQLTAYEIEPYIILSTQLNFKRILMKLTQAKDRTNFIVANSIKDVNNKLTDYIHILGADIQYNWVDYSSLIGINYLFNLDTDNTEFINTKIVNNQVIYEPVLFKSTSYGFKKLQ